MSSSKEPASAKAGQALTRACTTATPRRYRRPSRASSRALRHCGARSVLEAVQEELRSWTEQDCQE
jgi:hypothetical protein